MAKIERLGRYLYSLLTKIGNFLQSPFLLAIRLYWGWMFLLAGYGKLTHIAKPIEFFTNLGIPFPTANAYLVGCTEFFGGIFLCLGFASRLTTIPLIISMVVAYITADPEALHAIISNPDQFYGAAPFTFLFASIVIFVFGAGKLSVDHLLKEHFFKDDFLE
jgi:putative oxidoreductase